MTPYYADESVTLYHGDALAVLRTMPDQSVDCCVTSPPYFGLRDYGEEGQYGLEASPAEYVETMRALFAEVRRVLADDGTLWLNLGDSYSSKTKGTGGTGRSTLGAASGGNAISEAGILRSQERQQMRTRRFNTDVPEKNLVGIPWRTAFALQDDGWILRNDVIWAKPNAMPESVADRLSTKHEHLFLFSKSPRYWFDLDAVREPLLRPEAVTEGIVFGGKNPEVGSRRGGTYKPSRRDSFARGTKEQLAPGQSMVQHREDRPDVVAGSPLGRNPGDVWTVSTRPFSEAHFAVMPAELARRAVVAGCKPGGMVLDPFSGSGTTGLVAGQTGRRYVGIDLNRDYLDLSLRTRLAQTSILDFGEPA
jgi:site-specific DNA-methyltransferase (cytosine-N4-specific)